MDKVSFSVAVEDFCWIDDREDNPEDLCAHAVVTVQMDGETLQDGYCASASAMRMLRTLTEDHIVEERLFGLQMLPCCGFNMYADETLENVDISGCYYGVDYEVRHQEDSVVITTERGDRYSVSLADYRREVLRFVRQVEEFYKQCLPKKLPEDSVDRNGYIAFWNEWKRRMAQEEERNP